MIYFVWLPKPGPMGEPQELLCSHSWVQIPHQTRQMNVLMAQWIERPTSNRKAAGSSPAKDYIVIM